MQIVFFGSSSFTPLVLPCLDKNIEVELTVDENNFDTVKVLNSKSQVAVLAALGRILPSEILQHFKYGVLNIHPSLLPKYRGPSPVQNAILNKDIETGVTIIKLDEEMDHGPILAQERVTISPMDTTQSLYDKLFPLGAKLLNESLLEYISGKKTLTEQNHADASYVKILTRDDGYIDLNNVKLDEFDRKLRAYSPWPGVWTKAILNTNGEQKIIKFLLNKKVQVEGKKEMSYKDFINGYPNTDSNLLEFLKGAA